MGKAIFHRQWMKLVLRSGLAITGMTMFLLLTACGKPASQPQTTTPALSSATSSTQDSAKAGTLAKNKLVACAGCLSAMRSPVVALSNVRGTTMDESVLLLFYLVLDASFPSLQIDNPISISQYYGRSTLLGMIKVKESTPAQICGAPVGTYQFRPLTPSYFTSGVISGGTFEALGPVRFVFRLEASSFTLTDGPQRLAFRAVVETVNDTPCGAHLASQ